MTRFFYNISKVIIIVLSGKGIAKPYTIAIPWTHSPVASKLGACPSDSLATTAIFISWNDAIIPDVLPMSFPDQKISILIKQTLHFFLCQ